MLDARDVRVRAVWPSLASPMSIAFAADDAVALIDPNSVAALTVAGDRLEVGTLRIEGSAEQLQELVDEARRATEREYLELGDVEILNVDGRLELRRGSGDRLRESAPSTLAESLQRERTEWNGRGVNYAKWTFTCGGEHFLTSPLRAAFLIDRIAAAVGRTHRG